MEFSKLSVEYCPLFLFPFSVWRLETLNDLCAHRTFLSDSVVLGPQHWCHGGPVGMLDVRARVRPEPDPSCYTASRSLAMTLDTEKCCLDPESGNSRPKGQMVNMSALQTV